MITLRLFIFATNLRSQNYHAIFRAAAVIQLLDTFHLIDNINFFYGSNLC